MSEALSPASKEVLAKYCQWARRRRQQNSKDVESELVAFQSAGLNDSKYNKGEVSELLSSLLSILKVTVERQQQDAVNALAQHAGPVLAAADASQAAAKLVVDARVLDDPSASARIAAFEQTTLAQGGQGGQGTATGGLGLGLGPKGGLLGAAPKMAAALPTSLPALPSLAQQQQPQAPQYAGPTEEELKAEQARLQEKLAKVQQQYTTMMGEKSRVMAELARLKEQTAAAGDSEATQALAREREQVRGEIQAREAGLQATQRAVSGRLNDGVQFRELKKMLAQKNQQVKDIRTKLAKYEPAAAAAAPEENAGTELSEE